MFESYSPSFSMIPFRSIESAIMTRLLGGLDLIHNPITPTEAQPYSLSVPSKVIKIDQNYPISYHFFKVYNSKVILR